MNIHQNPSEADNLLNPAFFGLLTRDTVLGYEQQRGEAIPYELVFLALPVIVHERTRLAFPRSVATKLHPWLQNNGHVRIGAAERINALTPCVRDSVQYACRTGLLDLNPDRSISTGDVEIPKSWAKTTDAKDLSKAAHFVGRWFAMAGPASFVFSAWGIRL